MDKYIVFEVTGGAGKNVMATALLKPLQQKYPDRKIIIVASWPDVFLYHPIPHEVYQIFHTPNFYHKYIENKDTIIFKQDPYNDSDFIRGKTHLIESWAGLLGLTYDPSMKYPDVRINRAVEDSVRDTFSTVTYPLMLIHSNGGGKSNENVEYCWTRDIPPNTLKDIVALNKHDYHIIQVCNNKDQRVDVDSTVLTPENFSLLELFALLKIVDKRLLIDSSLQHVSAAWGLDSTVLWVGTKPHSLGYDCHKNLLPVVEEIPNFKLPNSYLYRYRLNGEPLEYPYVEDTIFDSRKIQDILMS